MRSSTRRCAFLRVRRCSLSRCARAMGAYLDAYNSSGLRESAKRRLRKGVFEFVDRGTEDEVSLRHNLAFLKEIKVRPRTLVDVSGRRQDITLFGKRHEMP